jgi:hypothetical protein
MDRLTETTWEGRAHMYAHVNCPHAAKAFFWHSQVCCRHCDKAFKKRPGSILNIDPPLTSPLLLHGIHGLLHSRRSDAAAHGFQNCVFLHDSAAAAYCILPVISFHPQHRPVWCAPFPSPLLLSSTPQHAKPAALAPVPQRHPSAGGLLSAPASTVCHVLRAPPAGGCASSTLF